MEDFKGPHFSTERWGFFVFQPGNRNFKKFIDDFFLLATFIKAAVNGRIDRNHLLNRGWVFLRLSTKGFNETEKAIEEMGLRNKESK